MTNKKLPIFSAILYILALILFGYAVWALVIRIDSVKIAIEQAQVTLPGDLFNVVNFCMEGVATYMAIAVGFVALGFIMQQHTSVLAYAAFGAIAQQSAFCDEHEDCDCCCGESDAAENAEGECCCCSDDAAESEDAPQIEISEQEPVAGEEAGEPPNGE